MSCNLEGIVKVLGSLSTLPVPRSNKRIKKRTGGRSSKRRIERKTVSPSASLVSWSRKRIQKKRRACTKRQRKKKTMRKYGMIEKRGIVIKLSKRSMRHFARGKEKSQLYKTSSEQVQITKRNCAKEMLEILQLFCMSFPTEKHELVSKPILKEKSSIRGLPGDFFKYYAAFVPKQYRHIFVYPASLNEYFLRLAKGPAFLQGEENKYEAVRLASFRAWPQWAPVAATRLARSGFYYSGNGDEVVCFSCGGHHRQWSHGDNPMDQHRLRFPDCRFVRGSDTANVPLVPGVALRDSSDGTDPFPNLVRSGSHGLLGGDLASQQALQQSLGFPNQDVLVQSLNSIGTSNSEISQLRGPANDSFSHYQHLAGTIGGGQDERDNDRNPTQTAGTFTHQSTEMKSEAARLRTFAHWPISAHVRPHDLAKAGFFYTGNADSVQCAFCSGILRNWDPGDRPMQEHRHHFPTCLYALGVDVGNIALEPDQANLPSAIQESLVTSSAAGGTATTLGGNFYRGDDLGILTERPKHERFAVESTRLATFSHWTSHNTQKPEVLAKAGFFYAGFADNVKCFFCDGGLRNWEHGDDPWTEHARWFPRCEFVKQCKGEDFIRDVQAKHPPQYPPNQPRPAIATPLPAQSSAAVARPPGQFPVEPREIKARLDTPTVQAVLEMGCSRTVVRTAIENRLRTVGDDFPNAESLLEAIFEIEESMNREESQSSAGGVPEPAQPPREQQPPQDTRSTNTTTQTKKKTEEKKNKKKKDKKGAGATIGPPGDKDEEAKSLMEENLRLKEQRTCKICMDEDVSVVFLPCGHLVACTQCAPALRNCPICRAIIRGTVRTFLS
ncbi:baculoviral IAP repeat-containing protein 3-like [Lingula anatina]|uniref:Baculoviral IAP repeat-containing protein 3-like n=1 Tax=Lingula anatina TaxID=7574 RepID=A0A1S3KI49_LINAN|nr:baculoviral IAP repeat-containing protein 3-like [Lingula anatina]|eukprot:XP_013421896.1 baculoviral IAP repeat-containing protein 3-like [Lingula anatina]